MDRIDPIFQFEHALVAYSRGLKVAPDFDGFQVTRMDISGCEL